MHWYVRVFERSLDFSGRSQRKEYWMFVLFNMLIAAGLAVGDMALGWFSPTLGLGLAGGIYSLVVLVPSWAVGIRRLHDVGRSGWWFVAPLGIGLFGGVGAAVLAPILSPDVALLLMVPWLLAMMAVTIAVIVFSFQDGQPFPNRYGPDPKGRGELPAEVV